jgi:hypothetical protein
LRLLQFSFLELNADYFSSLFPQEVPDPVMPKTPPIKRVGSNVEEMNYIKICLYFLVVFGLYQVDAIKIGLVKVYKYALESTASQRRWFFPYLLILPSLVLFLISTYSFFEHLPDLFGDVDWVEVGKSRRGRLSQSFHVWSSGWSYLLLHLSSALCHLGILHFYYKVMQPSMKSNPSDHL